MFRNIKYTSFYTYSNGVILDGNVVLSASHIIYDIIKKYPIPSHLTNVKIVKNTSLEEADNNLVFTGVDSNGKTQYFYGESFVDARKTSKKSIFVESAKVIDDIMTKVDTRLQDPNQVIDSDFIISTIILLELKTFIRLGKQISFDIYQSIGIRTLKKAHFTFTKDGVDISFIGKSQVSHVFQIPKDNKLLIKCLKLLYTQNTNSDFIFALEGCDKPISEYKINKFLRSYKLTFKNLRTYGCNIIFLKHFYEIYMKRTDKESLKKIVNKAIKEAALDIGHSVSISKGSYLVEDLISHLNTTIEKLEENSSYEEFLSYFIDTL